MKSKSNIRKGKKNHFRYDQDLTERSVVVKMVKDYTMRTIVIIIMRFVARYAQKPMILGKACLLLAEYFSLFGTDEKETLNLGGVNGVKKEAMRALVAAAFTDQPATDRYFLLRALMTTDRGVRFFANVANNDLQSRIIRQAVEFGSLDEKEMMFFVEALEKLTPGTETRYWADNILEAFYKLITIDGAKPRNEYLGFIVRNSRSNPLMDAEFLHDSANRLFAQDDLGIYYLVSLVCSRIRYTQSRVSYGAWLRLKDDPFMVKTEDGVFFLKQIIDFCKDDDIGREAKNLLKKVAIE